MGLSHGAPSTMKSCPTCGCEFKVYACVLKRGSGKYCSKACRPYQGSGNPKWRGGRVTGPDGRVMVYAPDNPGARLLGGKYIYEYRIVAGETLGRPLRDDEIVHHIDGNHTNNAPENLEVMTQGEHMKRHGLPGRNRKAATLGA